MTDIELDAIEARAKAATKGPWEIQKHGGVEALFAQTMVDDVPVHGLNLVYLSEPDWNWPANSAFIAASRSDVEVLVAELRAARAKLRAVAALPAKWRARNYLDYELAALDDCADELEAALRGANG